jgi:hypothetical protein
MTAPWSAAVSSAAEPPAAGLLHTARLLWPAPLQVVDPNLGAHTVGGRLLRQMALVPSASRPRMLVPADQPRAAAAALRAFGGGKGIVERLASKALAAVMPFGAASLLLRNRVEVWGPDGADRVSIESHLSNLLGEEITVSIRIGSLRINQKPVLLATSLTGRIQAYVKVGHNSLARRLVLDEAAALAIVAEANAHVVTPHVRHLGRWCELELLVLSPVPTIGRRTAANAVTPVDAMLEVMRVGGVSTGAVQDLAVVTRLLQQAERLSDREASTAILRAIYHAVEHHGDVQVKTGCWHGDWAPWNMALSDRKVVLWDWERFGRDVPFGFDALHFALYRHVATAGGDWSAGGEAWHQSGTRILAEVQVGVGEPDVVKVTQLLYLAEIAIRFADDAQSSSVDQRPPQQRPPFAQWAFNAVQEAIQ